VTTPIEHASVLGPVAWLERRGWAVTRVPVDGAGRVDPDEVRHALRPDTVLVSIAHANNEIGTLQPVEAIAALCVGRGVAFHTDACQSFTRARLAGDGGTLPDLVSLNAHKLHGPKGIGALRVRRGLELEALLHGGDQEAGLRPGTANTPAAVGFGVAAGLTRAADVTRMTRLRDALIEGVLERIPGSRLNGPRQDRLCCNAHFAFPGRQASTLAAELDRRGVRVSRGSACTSASVHPSHVLTAIGLPEALAMSSLRLSLSLLTTEEEIARAVEALAEVVRASEGRS